MIHKMKNYIPISSSSRAVIMKRDNKLFPSNIQKKDSDTCIFFFFALIEEQESLEILLGKAD